MKLLIWVSGLLALASAVSFFYAAKYQPDISPIPPTARLGVYVSDPEKHLGVVGLYEQVRGSFVIVNDTDKPITLAEPMKSCSCTAAELERRELGPGERCSLTVVIHTGSRRGPRTEAWA